MRARGAALDPRNLLAVAAWIPGAMHKPTISVVMAVHNGEPFLGETLSSVLQQTYDDFELLVIDDASTDDTANILAVAAQDPRVHRLRNAKNLGLTRSLNCGLQAARGRWIARLDVGDVALPERLERQLAYVEAHPEYVLVGTAAAAMDGAGRPLPTIHVCSTESAVRARLPKGNMLIHSSILFRNREDIRYREKFVYAQDYDLYLRLLSAGQRLTNMPTPLVRYRVLSTSISSTKLTEQYAFAEQARQFYRQRQSLGHDLYDEFLPATCLDPVPRNDAQGLMRERIHAALRAADFGTARREMRQLFRRHGLWNLLSLRYLYSYAQQLQWEWQRRRSGGRG